MTATGPISHVEKNRFDMLIPRDISLDDGIILKICLIFIVPRINFFLTIPTASLREECVFFKLASPDREC